MPTSQVQLPPELATIPLDRLKLVLPDVAVSLIHNEGPTQVSHCHRATFKITLSPGVFSPRGDQLIDWKMVDKVNGVPKVVGTGTVVVPASGGSATVSYEFPMPADESWTPDFSNVITIQVDPEKKIAERDESNNEVTFTGTCVG